MRPDDTYVKDLDSLKVWDVIDYEHRIREAIDLGHVLVSNCSLKMTENNLL